MYYKGKDLANIFYNRETSVEKLELDSLFSLVTILGDRRKNELI